MVTLQGGKLGVGIMVPLAPVMTEATIRNSTEEAIYDRSYRIRNNRNQMRADRFATCGAMLGSVGAKVVGGSVLTGLILGLNIGTISAGVVNNQLAKASKD